MCNVPLTFTAIVPPIRVARSKGDASPRYAHEVVIHGDSRLVYDAGNPILRCGARLAIEAAPGAVEVVR